MIVTAAPVRIAGLPRSRPAQTASKRTPRPALSAISGRVIWPGDVDYDAARRSGAPVADEFPALILRAADARDVALAIAFAEAAGIGHVVRNGGTGIGSARSGDGAVVIDVSQRVGPMVGPYDDIDEILRRDHALNPR